MASRKRPHDSIKPQTPTNGLNSSLQEINLHNGSNSNSQDAGNHNNGDSNTMFDQTTIKYAASRPVSFISECEQQQVFVKHLFEEIFDASLLLSRGL